MGFFRQTAKADNGNGIVMLPPEKIYEGASVRRGFDAGRMAELAQSIRQNGIVQPICVIRRTSGEYELVFGERRLKAAVMAEQKTVPCMILPDNTEQPMLISLAENLQREDLSFFEQADGIYALSTEYNLTRREIAEKLGLSESAISNKLRLLRLSVSQRESIENMNLSERHARTLLRICDEKGRTRALREMIDRRMNVEEAERYVDRLLAPSAPTKHSKMVVRDIRLFINSINKAVNVMKISGINASTEREEDEDYIKYTVLIPKKPSVQTEQTDGAAI